VWVYVIWDVRKECLRLRCCISMHGGHCMCHMCAFVCVRVCVFFFGLGGGGGVVYNHKCAQVQKFGADEVIDYTKDDYSTLDFLGESDYDIVFDTVGEPESFNKASKVLIL